MNHHHAQRRLTKRHGRPVHDVCPGCHGMPWDAHAAAAAMEHPDLSPAFTQYHPSRMDTLFAGEQKTMHRGSARIPRMLSRPSANSPPRQRSNRAGDPDFVGGLTAQPWRFTTRKSGSDCSQYSTRWGLMASSRGQMTHFPAHPAITYFE